MYFVFSQDIDIVTIQKKTQSAKLLLYHKPCLHNRSILLLVVVVHPALIRKVMRRTARKKAAVEVAVLITLTVCTRWNPPHPRHPHHHQSRYQQSIPNHYGDNFHLKQSTNGRHNLIMEKKLQQELDEKNRTRLLLTRNCSSGQNPRSRTF